MPPFRGLPTINPVQPRRFAPHRKPLPFMLTFAIRNLLSRPLRSLLSLLGLTVAIMGMVGLFSVAHGFDQQLIQTFGQIPGLAAMQPGAPIPIFSKVPAAWGEEIEEVEGVSVVTSEIWQRINVINGKMIVSPPRFWFGIDIEQMLRLREDIYGKNIVEGRHLQLQDRGTNNCLISKQIAEEYQVGVDDQITVNGYPHTVKGIYHTGSLLLDVAVVLDMEQVRQMSGFASDSVTSFYIEPEPGVNKDQLTERIKDVFRGRELPVWNASGLGWGISQDANPIQAVTTLLDRWLKTYNQPSDSPGQPNASVAEVPKKTSSPTSDESTNAINPFLKVEQDMPLEVRTAQEWGKRFDKFAEDLDLLLMLLTGIGVTIAVLSIVNTMVMSVTERIIEIGILKANGWSRTDVLKLITFESALLGLGGGLLGSFLGWVGTLIVNWNWPNRVELYAGPGLLSFSVAFAVVLGILGGLYPAFWAMRMMPMDAIRRG